MKNELCAIMKENSGVLNLDRLPEFNIDFYVEKIIDRAVILTFFEKKIKGFIAFYCNDPSRELAYVTMIAVSEGAQGKGIGGTLLSAMMLHLSKIQFKTCRLKVDVDNERAVQFYKSFGFTELAREAGQIDMERPVVSLMNRCSRS